MSAELGLPLAAAIAIACAAVLFAVVTAAGKLALPYGRGYLSGLAPLALIFALGCACHHVQAPPEPPPFESRYFECGILTAPAEKPKSYAVNAMARQSGAEPRKVCLYLAKDSAARELKVGDRIAANARLKPAEGSYLKARGISATAYLPAKKWTKTKSGEGFSLKRSAAEAKKTLTGIFYEYMDEEHAAIAAGLCLGDGGGIEKATKQNFSAIGISHVLSVSGMHVGVIYGALCKLLGFMKCFGRFGCLRHLIIIAAVWGYCFICGLPASAIRSAFMFSVMSAAAISGRRSSSLNCLSFAFFCMLAHKTSYLFDVGFQLSFAAVLGIITMGRSLTEKTRLSNRALRYVCEAGCISIAAQAATAPFCLYYFNQFPNYFLAANIVIVPFASLLIYVALALAPLSAISPAAASIAGSLANFLSASMMKMSAALSSLPYSQITGVKMNPLQLIMLIVVIFGSYMFFKKRSARFLRLVLSCMIILMAENLAGILFFT